jgi:hypothetical protein
MKLITLLALLMLLPMLCRAAPDTVPTVPRDGKFEASFTLPDQTGNPFDPRDNDVDVTFLGPSRRPAVVPAFWDGDRWRVRYAPTAVGAYTLSVTRNGPPAHPVDLTAARFRCTASADPGFVRRDAQVVQRFVFDDKQPYYPLGMNVAWTGGSAPDYPVYFAQMGAAHMNWARVWMTYWDGKALEWSPDKSKNPPRGYFLMDAARRWDMIFDQAAQHGIYIQMVLQHHGQYTNKTDPNWVDNPFNIANGGFLKNPDDFFTDAEARRLTKAKYRYIVARWGYATHLLAFELFNEVQNISEANTHFQDVVDWHKEMAAYLRSIDIDHHLITTSNSVPGEPLSQIGLDYDQIHTYPGDIVSTFGATKTAGVAVPVFYGEWGPADAKNHMTEAFLHDGLWASLASPTAGAGQFWYWDQVLPHAWWPQFASAQAFVQMSGLPNLGAMQTVRPTVDAPGPRGDLSFAPPGGWESTTRFDVTILPDGQTPDLAGLSSFIQGNGHRDMLPKPIVFHLNAVRPCQFRIRIDTVARSGAHPILTLDGRPAQEADFPAADKDTPSGRTLTVDLSAGPHTVSLFNTGPDWFVLGQVAVTGYAPAVAALAKADAHAAIFWAYTRDRDSATPRDATLTLPGLAPGNYTVRLWDPWTGQRAGTSHVKADTSGVSLVLHGLQKDMAGVVTAR